MRSCGLLFSFLTGPYPHSGGTSSIKWPEKTGRGVAAAFFR
jgi:hypothetical protein